MNNTIIDQLDNVIAIFNQLKEEPSSNNKISIIKRNKDNTTFVNILKFVFDDFIRTGVSSKTLHETDTPEIIVSQGIYTIDGILSYIKAHNTGSFSAIAQMKAFLEPFNKKEQGFLIDVFSKELKAGITAKTINKALGDGFIKQFSVQLAFPYHKYPDKVPGQEFVLTQKLDGHRSICIVKDDNATFYTRKGLIIPGLNNQIKEAVSLVNDGFGYNSYVLDGELLLDPSLYDMETKDLFRATSRILRGKKTNKDDIIYNIFDALPLDEFMRGRSTEIFTERKNDLYEAFKQTYGLDTTGDINDSNNNLHLVRNLYDGRDIGEIKTLEKEYVDRFGWEGLMINLAQGHYETKRTTSLLKVKEFFDADVVCTDVFEGTGRLKGTLGGIVVDYKGYPIKVGSGFTDIQRDYYWKNPNEIIGKVVAISYFEETHNQNNDDLSLRFPTFLDSREGEKTVEDVSYEI